MQTDIVVKDKIIETASKFFSHFGFQKTTMDEIAKKIHKAKGSLYYHFRSKEELYNEVLKQELHEIKAELSKITQAGKNPVDTFEEYIKTRLKLLQKAKNYHETIKSDFTERYGFVDDVRRDFDEFERRQLTEIFKSGEKSGVLKVSDIKTTIELLIILLKSIEIPLYIHNKYEEYDHNITELITLISNGLRFKAQT